MATTVVPRRVARHAGLTKDLIRAGRSRTHVPQQNPYVAQLAKDLLSRTDSPRRAFDQVAALVTDLADRGSLEDAEAVGLMYVAIARFEYQKRHAAPATVTVPEAHLAEEEAEGAADVAEIAMRNAPGSVAHYLAYLRAAAAHTRARLQLDAVIRREVVAQNVVEG